MPDTFTPDQFSQTQPITTAGSTPCAATSPGDPIKPLWEALNRASEALNAADRDPSEEIEDAYYEASDRFVDAHTTSTEGILRKLEHLAAVENMEKLSKEEPQLINCRIVLGLIKDLREAASRPSDLPSELTHSIPNRLQTSLSGAASEIEYLAGTITTGLKLAGTTLELLCGEANPPAEKDRNPSVLPLINQLQFVLDSIEARAGQIIAESDKVYKASFKLRTADRSALVS